jgi:alanyl-tRNA synthetase
MSPMHPNAIRASFLEYFARHGHRTVASSPLVPHDDPTLLFTNAGMNQFKDVFLGRESRDYARAATAQKCMRVSGKHNDLENVGPSLRHHTFFEMLGNFSFGDYFKEDAIALAWRLLTDEWGLDPARLRVTIFKGDAAVPRDDEAFRRWRDFVPAEHVGELGADDNFWAMGDTGPCGRCSEIYVDRGPGVAGSGDFMTDIAAGSERFVEIWNNVFMEFDRDAHGVLTPLPARSIDTGMGLERIAAVMLGTISNYDTALFTPLLEAIGALAGRRHGGTMDPADISMRVVADHLRAMTFLLADGVVPSNEWRGYVLRKIMRRAMRHGRRLGLEQAFLYRLVDVLVGEMGAAYPELAAGRDAIVEVVRSEEDRFEAVLTGGLPRLEDVLAQAGQSDGIVRGDEAFKLYDTYGLPRDFIEDLTAAQQLRFDAAGFDAAMARQREQARAKSAFEGGRKAELAADVRTALADVNETFIGYDMIEGEPTPIVALLDASLALVDVLPAGADGFVILAATPFYLEAGGQVSDTGVLVSPGGATAVVDVVRLGAGLPRGHRVRAAAEPLTRGLRVTPRVDGERRAAIRRNHTATHLLHAALRETLGGHVKQAGSLVAPDRLRFDFVHTAAVKGDERQRIERIVNRAILANRPVHTAVKDTQQAIADGATALFGEKYGDRVRVVSIGDGTFSTELCGGTHVTATGDIGLLVLTEESGVAAGVRRIEALTGIGALAYLRAAVDDLQRAAAAANVPPDQLAARVETQAAALAKAQREIRDLKTKLAMGGGGAAGAAANTDQTVVGAYTVVVRRVDGLDREALRSLADDAKSKLTDGVVFLAGEAGDGRVAMVAAATPGAAKKAPAGSLVKQLAPLVGGGGGGRPDFAEAGGKDPARIAELLAAARPLIEKLLQA